MTDREFDDLLKTAFDRYAKETLAKIPDLSDLDLPKSAPKRATKKKSAALVLLTAACLSLLALSALLIAKLAAKGAENSPSVLPAVSQSVPDNPSAALSPGETEARLPIDTDATVPAASPDTVTEDIYPNLFHPLTDGPQQSYGDMGEFADLMLVQSDLPPLPTPAKASENRAFDKRTGGSYEFWYGSVQIFLQYETPVLPVAITYTFQNPDLVPRNCTLSGQNSDGSWTELQSYTCSLTEGEVTVAFYLEFDGEDLRDSTRYTDLCLSYEYVAMPDENYEVPVGQLYGFEGQPSDFRFARYYVSGGSLYALSTNAEQLTIPDSFGGSPLRSIRKDSVLGEMVPRLRDLTLPEGVQTIEACAFSRCDALEQILLPASFTQPIPVRGDDPENAEILNEEIRENEDLDGDGIIGAPLSAILRDCAEDLKILVSGDNPLLESKNGSFFLRGTNVLLFQNKSE